jgi:hypothetical protein
MLVTDRHRRPIFTHLALVFAMLLASLAGLFAAPQSAYASSDPGLLISEFLANPTGSDTNQEYVELIATKTIDFSVTPYSVVFSNNGTATTNGWIAGSAITYGFSITSGVVNRGDVVYVGGSGMAPIGTKLRVIDVTTTGGDRFGSAQTTNGVLGNGGANADAVAVFNVGINTLTNTTVPVDAIFFGTGTGSAVVSGGSAGYELPVNDRYTGGKLQSNSFLAPDPSSAQVTIATGAFNTSTGQYTSQRVWANSATATNGVSAITLEGDAPPVNQPISASATPPSVTTPQGTAASSALSATDPDSIVNNAVIQSGGAAGITLDGFVPATVDGGTATATLNVAATTAAGSYSVVVRFTNDDAQIADLTVPVAVNAPTTACSATDTPINQIQGSGNTPALTGVQTVQGVVVGDYEGAAGVQGFYLQEVAAVDASDTTSEGIFVYNGTRDNVQAGQLVQVTGQVTNQFNETRIGQQASGSTPEILPTAIEICGPGTLPAAVAINFPIPAPVSGVSFLERYEGMLITLPQDLVISEYFNYDRFGEYSLALPLTGESRPYTPTSIETPGSPGYQNRLDLNTRSRIVIDDGSNLSNPATGNTLPNGQPFSLANRFRGGDKVTGFTGVLGFGFSAYRVQPTTYGTYTRVNSPPAAPENVGGRLKVAAFNTLNYYLTPDYPTGDPLDNKCGPDQDLECRGWDSDQPTELQRQRDKLLATLSGLNADVVGLIEIENTTGVEAMTDIVAGLPGYSFINTGAIGTDAIKVGIIYRSSKVTPVGAAAVLDTQAFVNPRGATIDRNRPAVAQTFEEVGTGARFTVVVNHLKSKGSACGAGDDDTTTGQGNCNETRRLAVVELARWLATDPTGSGDPDFLIIGDLNAYAKEAPIAALESAGYTNLIAQFGGPLAYSYLFDAQFGYLDYALANASLTSQVTGVTEWHINADEADLIDYDTSFKSDIQDSYYAPDAFRSADHDPVLVGLNLTVPNTPPALSVLATYDTGLGANGAEIISVAGNRAVLSNAPDGSIDILDVTNLLDINRIQRVQIPELAGLTSVAIHPTKDLFVAVAGASQPSRYGTLLVFRLSTGALLAQTPLAVDAASPNGRQPDAVEFSPDGRFAVVAIEAEQVSTSEDGGNGAIAVADFSGFDPDTSTSISASTVELPNIAGVAGVSSGRTHGDASGAAITNAPGTIEPEGVAFAADSSTVYVTLQENNAVARLSLGGALPATLPVSEIFGLGQTTHAADLTSNSTYAPTQTLTAFREPDGLRSVDIGGTRYVVTADEGDTRPNPRGGRTISIFNAATGALVADTGSQLDDLAARYGVYPDSRSPNGGSEPEMLDVIAFGGRVIAAVGLERANALAFVDITTPTAPRAFALVRSGSAPEGIKLVERGGQLFVLSANEGNGTVTTATVPVIAPDVTLGYVEDTARAFGIGAIDNDGDNLTLTLTVIPVAAGTLSAPSGGLSDLGGGVYSASGNADTLNDVIERLVFTPAPNFNGQAVLSFALNDGSFPAASGTITLVGTPVNDAPVATDDSYGTNEDTPLSVLAPGVLANDNDIDGNTLTAVKVSDPANGTVVLNDDGSFTYTPNANFNGSDSFTYKANDGTTDSNVATVTITVAPVNDPPTISFVGGVSCAAGNIAQATVKVVVNDVDGDTLTLSLAPGAPSWVQASFDQTNRTVTFTLTPEQNNARSFLGAIRVSDGQLSAQTPIGLHVGTQNDNQINALTAGGGQYANVPNVILGLGGQDRLTGGNLADTICAGNGDNQVFGNGGNDLLVGGATQDRFEGGDGDDVIQGRGGDDQLNGGDGNDILDGGDGNDRLNGDAGNDTLTGGSGQDRFDGGPGTDRATDRQPGEQATGVELFGP